VNAGFLPYELVSERPVGLDAHVCIERGAFQLDAQLRVGDGEFCVVVGPNGAGKTTLLRALAGLTPIARGWVRFGSELVDDPAQNVFVPAERRSVGFVFQDYLLFPHLSALDNVAFGLRARGMRRDDARARAREWLARVHLVEKGNAKPGALSGGEAQRVAVVRALAPEPAVLLMDEPLAALDVQHRAGLRRDLRDVLAAFTGARVLVTHDAVDALTLGDRVLILEDGRIVQDGTPDEVVARPASSYAADLVGMNLYDGDATGDAVCLSGGARLTVADRQDGPVVVVIPPRAVVLHNAQPASSARNAWPGTISGIERLGDRVRVGVDGQVPIVAEVTANAVSALALQTGASVWVAVKATEIAVHPR
jgi:molybdate transport system ATP-binding protein